MTDVTVEVSGEMDTPQTLPQKSYFQRLVNITSICFTKSRMQSACFQPRS